MASSLSPFCRPGTHPVTEEWTNQHLHSLDLPTLLEETPSPNIHVWMTPMEDGKPGPIESFETDDVNTALVCHNAGRASLYFRAPQPMADQVVRELSNDLGPLAPSIVCGHSCFVTSSSAIVLYRN